MVMNENERINVGIRMINHPFGNGKHSNYLLRWLGDWSTIVIPTWLNFDHPLYYEQCKYTMNSEVLIIPTSIMISVIYGKVYYCYIQFIGWMVHETCFECWLCTHVVDHDDWPVIVIPTSNHWVLIMNSNHLWSIDKI